MKKVLWLIVAMLIIGSVSFADDTANGTEIIRNVLVKMTDDQLFELKDMVEQEIHYRGLDGELGKGSYAPWHDYGLGKMLPNPEVYLGHLLIQYGDFVNTDIGFTETLGPMQSHEFESYVDFLIKCGFSNNFSRFTGAFHGENADNVIVVAYLEDGKMSIMCNS